MRYRLLGKSGLRVSELALGTMTFGEDWGWGADKATSQKIFDLYTEQGGNFIDTSINYTNGTAEKFVGEFVKAERDRFVIATKYSLRPAGSHAQDPNAGGNSRKAMMRSVETSLRQMDTDHIDLLYLHMWDSMTPAEEVLRGADDLIRRGDVLYFAFSDTPAWIISYAIAKSEQYGWSRPVGIQIPYSLLDRSVENDVLPMARVMDLAILPWGMLEGGALTGKHKTTTAGARRENPDERQKAAADVVLQIGDEIGRSASQVAINWVRQQPGNMIPILGCRTEAQIKDNLACLEFTLNEQQMTRLSEIAGFKLGFPRSFLESGGVKGLVYGSSYDLIDKLR